MKPDYAKATAELLDRLRRHAHDAQLPPPPAPMASAMPPNVVIQAPRDCVFYIGAAPTPRPPADAA